MEPSCRFRYTNSWGGENASYPSNHVSSGSAVPVSSTKLRLMCSSGGHIVPRPHDKSLRYIGGETHMVVVDRHTTLLDLTSRMSEILHRSSSTTSAKASSFTLKYQLPLEDLDSLISLTTDEDLENMIEEYERLNSSSSSRLRLFIFPTNPECSSRFVESVLQNSIKSDEWFVKALNGTDSTLSDTSPVNWLLNLDDEISPSEKKDVNQIPDSPVMESSSSFGSESSSQSLANLPSIRVNSDQQHNYEHHNHIGVENNRHPNKPIDSNSDSFLSIPEKSDQRLQTANLKHHQLQFGTTKIQEQITQTSASLLSTPTTQIESPRDQLHHQQPQFLPTPQYTYRHPSWAVPAASYYHHLPMDQRNYAYYMPARQQLHAAAAVVSGNQTVLKTALPAGATQPVMNQPHYIAHSENIHQQPPSDEIIYYAMQPLSGAQYKRMTSISPVDRSQFSRTPVTTAKP